MRKTKPRVCEGSAVRRVCGVLGAVAVALVLTTVAGAAGDGPPQIMRVEEDWQVVLNEPDEHVDAPQFHTIISPAGSVDSAHFQICWNYREQPEFLSGGLELAVWDGELLLLDRSVREDKLSRSAETVSWTQTLRLEGGSAVFSVKNGSSLTWGSFGGPATRMSCTVDATDLSQYRTSCSVVNSWISYGANRVNLLQIKEVRYYDVHGTLVCTDRSPKVVYKLEEPCQSVERRDRATSE